MARMGPWGFADALVLLSPIAFLVAMVLKPKPMATAKSLWLAAILLFVLKLWYLGASPLEACACFIKGCLQALTPCSIVAGAIFLFDCMESSQCLAWMKVQLRLVTNSHPIAEVMLIGFCFAFVVEGASGFGTPAALAAPMLYSMGHPKMECVICLLCFNTCMTIFGAVGTPVWFGIGEVVPDYAEADLLQVGFNAAIALGAAAVAVVPGVVYIIVPWDEVRPSLLFIYMSTLSCVLPLIGLSFVNYEFPTLAAGIVGLCVTTVLTVCGIGLGPHNRNQEDLEDPELGPENVIPQTEQDQKDIHNVEMESMGVEKLEKIPSEKLLENPLANADSKIFDADQWDLMITGKAPTVAMAVEEGQLNTTDSKRTMNGRDAPARDRSNKSVKSFKSVRSVKSVKQMAVNHDKKALWRRFQSVVAPILAEVIAYVDRDGNLELAASGDTWVFNLWLKIFGDSSLSEISFESFMSQEGDISVVRSKVPVPKSGYGLHAFQSKFPFSWLLKERIDELYREARSIAANSHENVTECLRTLLNSSGVNSVVSEAITEGGEKTVAACYLHDFTHMVYKPRSEEEVEVVQRAITAAAREIHHSAQSQDENFVMDLALVHVAHSRIQRRLNCLSLLLQTTSDIAQDLLNTFAWDENEMTIDAIALQMCLERMEPGEEDVKDMSRRRAWCDLVLSVKIPVEEMISKSSTRDEARIGEKTESIITQCRCMWQRLSAVRMFIEHVYPYQDELDPQDLKNTLTLWKALRDWTDFSKIDSLNIIERFLVRCSEDSIPRSQADKSEYHEKFLQRCNSFFMEIVSVFCFGEDVRELDPDVFEMLMRFVTGSQSTCETKEFSPFPEFGMDSSPVVRSFLLQQLINSNDKRAKKHLERYLYGVQGLSSELPHILNVCLLAVQCMENSWISSFSKNANLDLAVNIGLITKLCKDALEILNKDFTSFDELQVDSLEAVAKARYILGVTAEYLYMSCVSDDEQWRKPETRNALDVLFTNVRALCTAGHSRSPALYLLKQLVKRYGGHSIATISQNEELSWIVPAEFQQREDDGMTLDRFLVYGVLYREVRDSLARAILSDNTDELIASLEALREFPGHAKDIVILLALYREVAVPQGMWSRNQHDKNALIIDVILKRFLSTSVRNLAKDLLKNSQGHGFPFLPFQDTDSMIESALPEILFHVTTVLQCINFDGILEPLKAIILAPNSMLNSFLPTMPEDSFGETAAAISEGGNWYQCPAGHRYFVGDCGKPTQTRDCPSCESGVAIGGEDHHLVKTNKLASRDDRSSTGHILGAPQRVIAERDLSPANVSLLRVILHSAMLAGACQQPEVVSQLIHPEVPAEDICRFIWEHLVNDVRNVSTSLERSEDEVLLLIHLVLAEIMSRSTLRELDYNGKWSTKEGRKEWENEFVNVFARPICTNLEERLQNFYGLSVNDRRLGNDPLMREIYEVDMPPPARTAADIHPGHAAFWKHRTRVTVEHIIRQFQEVKSNMATCKVLGKFLAEEHNLRAVRYLPDILALLRILSDRFHRRIDREKANQLKIRELLQEFSKKGQKENVTKLLRSFSAAWDQVRHHLSSQGRFAPSKEQCSQSIEMSSTASVLLPASAEAGVCCKGLLFFLVNVHNELVQTYCNAVNPNGSARTAEKIPLSEVSMSQLIAYDSEKDLMPVMLANCSYSLEVGKETQLQYNWETLEKRIIDRFIRGRSLVHFELDDFMFREDARDDFSFEQLRIKIPQEPIQGHNRNQILSELKDLKDVSDLLSMLEMAIGFLSRTGGNPEMKISYYLKTVLLLSEGKSSPKIKKVLQSSSLNNILDLWSTLAIVRADLLLKNGQDPFEKVPDIFKTEMPRKVTTHFSAELKKVDIDLFLSKVVEVISLWLPQEDEQTGDMGLGEYLDGKLQYEERIPEDVCVKHVIYAWQLALEARERDQGRRRSMMS